MNLVSEQAVLNAIYLTASTESREYLRFNEIAKKAGFYKRRSSLTRVLSRLEKRGWIEKTPSSLSLTGLSPNEIVNPASLGKDLIPKYKNRDLFLRKRGIFARRAINKILPRKHVFYRLIKYPFVVTTNNQQKISDVPKGTKRFWKKAAQELMQAFKDEGYPFWLPHNHGNLEMF